MLNLISILAIGFLNHADPTGNTTYPSGIKECDKEVFNAPEASKLPLLKLTIPVFDINNKKISPGIYEGEISQDQKYIYLLQSKKIIAKLPVTKVITLNKKIIMPIIECKTLNDRIISIIYKDGHIEIQSIFKRQ